MNKLICCQGSFQGSFLGDAFGGGFGAGGGGGSPSGEAGQLSNNPADAGQHNASVQAASNLAGYTGSAPGGQANAPQITAITEPYKKAFKSTFINDLKTVAMFAVAPISTLAKSILGRTNDIASMKSQLSALGLTEAQVNAAISDVYSGAVDFGQGPDGSGDRSLVNTIVAGVQPNGTLSGDGLGDGDGGPGGLASNSQFTPSQLQLQSLLSQYGITGPPDPTTLEGSAMANIDLQKSQLAKIEELTGPYRRAGTDVALPNLSALAFGGNVDYQPSQLYNQQLSAGRQGVMRSQAAGGAGVKSSRTFERLADLVSGLAGEDLGRFEQGNQTLLNQALTATNQLGQAGSQLTGNVGNIYGNLGQGLNLAAQQRGQGQLAQSQTLKSGVTGLGDLLSTLYKGN